MESPLELRRLAVPPRRPGSGSRPSLRVNRAHAGLPGTHQMTGAPTPFGIDEAQLAEAVELAHGHPALRLSGFSLHAVSNNLDAAAHAAFVADAVRWSVAAAATHRIPLDASTSAAGSASTTPATRRFDLDVLADGLAKAADELPAGARLVFELGPLPGRRRRLVRGRGLDLKRNHGRWFAVLRGGTHHFRLPAAWGYSHPFTVLPIDEWARPYDRPEVRDVRGGRGRRTVHPARRAHP